MLHFGFSYIWLIYLLMLFVPNGFWVKRKPEKYDMYVQKESKALRTFERVGEMLTCECVFILSDINIRKTY